MKGKNVKWYAYFFLGLCAFMGLGIEALYAYLIEPILYGNEMGQWTTTQIIIHWILTCITWGLVSFWLIRVSKEKYEFNLLKTDNKIKMWQWFCVAICVIFSLVNSYIGWNGFKVVIEYQFHGLLKFIFQYIYYAIETVLFMLIIIFVQKSFEVLCKNKNIPYGGIACAMTWGLAHIFTKGSISVGLFSALSGFMFGVVYLLLGRDIKKTYPVLFIMFML